MFPHSTLIIWMVALSMALVSVNSCAPGPVTEAKPGTTDTALFRHRWWNYYARGLASAERRDYPGAIADFETALGQRARDQRMARTYGMHFVDYFPHRELGILYWEGQRLEAAQEQLEMSIAQAPTAKARHFLDRVREARIRQRIQEDPVLPPPPDIRPDVPDTGIRTRGDPVVISGTAVDPNYIASLTIAGQAVFLEGARQRVDFRQDLHLPQGLHHVSIEADSLAGLSSRQSIRVDVDRQGPVVVVQSVEHAAKGADLGWVLSGRVFDPSGVATLMANRSPVLIRLGTEAVFRVDLDPRATAVTLTATDELGNPTHIRLDLGVGAAILPPPAPILLASREPLAGLIAGLFRRDKQAPTIELKGWTAFQEVYMDQVVIDGRVRDDQQVAGIFINDQPVSDTPLSGVIVGFSRQIRLEKGANRIAIAATDTAGNRVVEEIVITRRTPVARLLRERLSVSVLPFGQKGQVTATSDAFVDLYLHQLALRNRFNLVDRHLLDVILQEHKINRSDLVAPDTALRTGRLMAADGFISGSIIETRMGMEVISRMVDTETTEVLAVVDAFVETKTLQATKDAAQRLALKLHREFPLVHGEIVDRRDHYLITDLGLGQLRAQRRVLVVQETPILHPVTRHPLGSDYRVLGRASLIQVQEKMSKGELHTGHDPDIGPAHAVITQ